MTINATDRIAEDLKALEWGLTRQCAIEYCMKIKENARQSCGLDDTALRLDVTADGDSLELEFALRDPEKRYCVKSVLEAIIHTMPITARPLFEHLLNRL